MDLAYGDLPPPDRWDRDRFDREGRARAPVIEERPPYRPSRGPAYYEDDRYYDREYDSGPRGTRDRRYFEEDQYYDPRAGSGALIPFRPAPPSRPAGPPRPRMLRRQSSVDRIEFDRRNTKRYYDDGYQPPPPAPREGRSSRYDIRIYDDVKIQDPEYYGDEGFREYREREWTRSRTRNDSPSPGRRAPTEIVDARLPVEEEIIEKKTVIEKPYPRRGKTRMPKRLVHTKVLFDLGYPFYEEDEKTILIEKALGPDNIDEIFAKSKEYRERETITTRLIEAPAAASATQALSEAPRSVREWDNIAALDRSPSPGSSVSQSTRKSHRRSKSHSSRQNVHETVHETDRISRHGSSVHESIHRSEHRDTSPAATQHSRKSRARSRAKSSSSGDGTTIVERKIIRDDDYDESGTIDLNFPLSAALVPSRAKSRTDADIRSEIRELERERRDLRRDTEIVRYDRAPSKRDTSPIGLLMEPPPKGEIVIADRRDGEVVAVRKDKRARSRSRPPGPGLLKSMMYTVT